jgi:hypothetical protein
MNRFENLPISYNNTNFDRARFFVHNLKSIFTATTTLVNFNQQILIFTINIDD